MDKKTESKSGLSESFIMGVIAIVFLLVGYQTALFIHNAAVTKIVADRDCPDTVFVYQQTGEAVRANSSHSARAENVRSTYPRRSVESFRFNPNTVSVEDLCRLGFTQKQAQSIENYRAKGGTFYRKSDFAESYVVSDSVFKRLEPYISIPLVDLNVADSAALDALPGIGGWFANKILEHRTALGGYSYKEQLMDIYRFDREKYEKLSDLVTIDRRTVTPYPLWTLPADELRKHPYIGNVETARAIVLFRESNPKSACTIKGLADAGVLSIESSSRLERCLIASPDGE